MLKPGDEAELTVNETGYYGAWFACTVLEVLKEEYIVQYCDIHESEDDNSPLQVEAALHKNVRPRPPELSSEKQWEETDAVEAYYMASWWEGVVKEQFSDGKYWVYFPATVEYMCFEPCHVRPRIKWAHDHIIGVSAWQRIHHGLAPQRPYVTPSQLTEYRARKGLPPEDNITPLCSQGSPIMPTPGQSAELQLHDMPTSSSEAMDEMTVVPLLSPLSLSPHASDPAHAMDATHASVRYTPSKRRASYARAFELPSKQECASGAMRKRRNATHDTFVADKRPLCEQQREAYAAVLRVFHSEAPALTWERLQLLDALRQELCIDNDTHNTELSKLPQRIRRHSSNIA